MKIKHKGTILLLSGLLLVVCLCCVAGIIVYLSVVSKAYISSPSPATASSDSDLSHSTSASGVKSANVRNRSVLQMVEAHPPTTSKPQVSINPIKTNMDFSDAWNYRITPDDTPVLNKEVQNHHLPELPTNTISSFDILKAEEEATTRKFIEGVKQKIGDSVRVKMSCPTCKLGVGLLLSEVQKGKSFEEIKVKFVSICTNFRIEIEKVCSGLFDLYGPEILPVLNTTSIGSMEICSMSVGEVCGESPNPLHEWEVEFPPVKKPPLPVLLDEDKGEEKIEENKRIFKVLHISDTHFDPKYMAGTVANCQEPLCCRADSTPPENLTATPVEAAGKWGSYEKCDSPEILIDNAFESIKKQHQDIDYILWTGDLPPHDIWNQSKEENLENIRVTLEKFYKIFPDVPVFPALGNHESVPAGHFPPPWQHSPDHNINWLYNKVAEEWSKFLPESTQNSLLHGGFYSVLIKPGFRIISLNMNYCHTISWWLYVNSTDPASELQWLIYQLQYAEDHGEKVHIIGHIPPGQPDCLKVWSRNFYNIINRYEQTILAQFYGHTHQDEFEVFYDIYNHTRATSIAYIGPSITTFENNNPGYRIYYVDEASKLVIDHETWYLNLTKANEEVDLIPSWELLYTARSAFNMSSLRPKDWDLLIRRMVHDQNLFNTFYKFYYRDSPTRPSCDTEKCKLQVLCDLKSGKSQERHNLCYQLETVLNEE